MSGTMRAIAYEQTGPAQDVLALQELPRPSPAPGEVLVQVAYSGVNPSDAKTRAGARGALAWPRVIPHSDGSGVIAGVGAGVDPGRLGQRVWLWNAAWGRAHGSCAEYIALPAAQAVALPDAARLTDGACLGIPALTAHRCLFADGPIDGQVVLVTGGAGAVGAYAVQMAKLAGAARVIATVSGPEKAAHASAMGADAVVNYREDGVAEAILEAAGGARVDRIVEVEFGGNLAVTRAVLAENGIVAAYGSMAAPEPALPFYPMMFDAQTLRMVLVYKLPQAARQAGIADVTRWLEAGALQHPVAGVHPIEGTAQAHDAVLAPGRIGAMLVRVAGDS